MAVLEVHLVGDAKREMQEKKTAVLLSFRLMRTTSPGANPALTV